MADAVVTTVVNTDPDNYTVVCTNLSDGTGETPAIKVDLSALTGATAIVVKKIEWASQGFTYFILAWDHTTDDVAALLPNGVGVLDYGRGKVDPGSTGGTGDLILTTVGHDSGDTYTIVLTLKILY
jgi:hypothetical protein